jgi:hypothetical protein
MSEAVAIIKPEESLTLSKVGAGLFKSGLFPNAKNEYGAWAIVQYGAELGIGPMMALKNINIISGQVACNAQLMLSLAFARGVAVQVLQETEKGCKLLFKRAGFLDYEASFTEEDAKAAGLAGKDNWKKYPRDMYYWRAVAKGVRRIAPEAVMGLYTPDEISEGKYIDVRDVPADPEPKKVETPPPSDGKLDNKQMQLAISEMLEEEYGLDAMDELERLTAWEKDGQAHAGKRNAFELAVKPNPKGQTQTSAIYHKVKTEYDKWKAADDPKKTVRDTLYEELAAYCGNDEGAMSALLKELTVFPVDKGGKKEDVWMRLAGIRKPETKESWVVKSLGKLREHVAKHPKEEPKTDRPEWCNGDPVNCDAHRFAGDDRFCDNNPEHIVPCNQPVRG